MIRENWLLITILLVVCLLFTHFIFDIMVKNGLLDEHSPQMRKAIFLTTYILSPLFLLGFLLVIIKGIIKGCQDGRKKAKEIEKKD